MVLIGNRAHSCHRRMTSLYYRIKQVEILSFKGTVELIQQTQPYSHRLNATANAVSVPSYIEKSASNVRKLKGSQKNYQFDNFRKITKVIVLKSLAVLPPTGENLDCPFSIFSTQPHRGVEQQLPGRRQSIVHSNRRCKQNSSWRVTILLVTFFMISFVRTLRNRWTSRYVMKL